MINDDIKECIELSDKLLSALSNESFANEADDDLQALHQLAQQRDKQITLLWEGYTELELVQHAESIEEIITLDKAIHAQALDRKSELAKKVLKQKSNNKATGAYLQNR